LSISFRKKWYESHDGIDVIPAQHVIDSTQPSRDVELTLILSFFRNSIELFTDDTISLFVLLRITRLDVLYTGIFIGTLIDLINHLPNLESMRVLSLLLLKPRCLSVEEVNTFRLVSNNNKITKVNIQWTTDLAQIQFLIDLCPSMHYLEINCSVNIDLKSLVRFILMKDLKYIPCLCRLCLHIPKDNHRMVEELQEMINFERLRRDYTIKHVGDSIYLSWK
jgi:hypothetical protein